MYRNGDGTRSGRIFARARYRVRGAGSFGRDRGSRKRQQQQQQQQQPQQPQQQEEQEEEIALGGRGTPEDLRSLRPLFGIPTFLLTSPIDIFANEVEKTSADLFRLSGQKSAQSLGYGGL